MRYLHENTLPAYGVPASSDAREYVDLIRRNLRKLLGTAVLGVLAGALYIAATPRSYEATALLRVESGGGLLENLLQSKPDTFNQIPLAKEEARVLRSRAVLGAAAKQAGQQFELTPVRPPLLEGLAARDNGLTRWINDSGWSSGYVWGPAGVSLAELSLPAGDSGRNVELVAGGGGSYELRINGSVVISGAAPGSPQVFTLADSPVQGTINVDVLDAHPGARFRIARLSDLEAVNRIDQAFGVSAKDGGSRVIELSYRGGDPQSVAATLNGILDAYQNVRVGLNGNNTRQELSLLQQRMPTVEAELKAAERALANYEQNAHAVDLVTAAQEQIRQAASLEAELTMLKIQRDQLAKEYTDRYPEVQKLNTRISSIQSSLVANRRALDSLPARNRQVVSLQREVEVQSELYSSLQERLQKLQVAEASTDSSVRVIDRAVAPERSIWPRASLILPLAVLASLAAHLAWLLLRAAMSNRLRDGAAIEQMFGLPVYIDIPYARGIASKDSRQTPLLGHQNGIRDSLPVDSQAFDSLRSMPAMLAGILDPIDGKSIMVCEPLAGMGRSFVSSNLAIVLAETGKRVLLVDTDLARGVVHEIFGADSAPGLSDLIIDDCDITGAVQATSVEGLFVMPHGSTQLFNTQSLEKVLHRVNTSLAHDFDYVIFDAPPVLGSWATPTIGKKVSASIMVIKVDITSPDEIQSALRRLQLAGVHVDGCIVNHGREGQDRFSYRAWS